MTSPYPHITQALAVAVAGDTVLVGPGRYAEELRTVRPGRPGAPIRIVGRPGTHLVGPRGRGRGRLIQVLHDHVTLQSLELSDANILVWVEGAKGVRLLRSRLHDAGGECMRLKGVATANEVAGNVIARCGRVRFNLARGSKNGEAIYIGTAPEQSGGRPDRSDGNRVHHNRIAATAECVDVKEAALRNLVERNRCSGSDDPDGGRALLAGRPHHLPVEHFHPARRRRHPPRSVRPDPGGAQQRGRQHPHRQRGLRSQGAAAPPGPDRGQHLRPQPSRAHEPEAVATRAGRPLRS